MEKRLHILLLEDSLVDAELIQRLLQKEIEGCECRLATNKAGFIQALSEHTPDVIVSDNSLPGFSAAAALKILHQKRLDLPFILVTGTVSEEFAANIIKLGADDYILKDRMARLPAAIAAAIEQHRVRKEIADFRYALDESAIVAITDQKGIIIHANDNFCKISKYERHELIGMDHRIINSGYHSAGYIRNLWVTIANGAIWRGEFRNKAKDGTLYWVDTTIVPFLNDKGKPYQYLSIRTDISEKKKAEDKLAKSYNEIRSLAERMSIILDTLPTNIALLDRAGNIIEVNKSWKNFAEANGFTGDNFAVGDNYIRVAESNSINPGDDGPVVAAGIREVLSNKRKQFVYEYACHSPQVRRWFRMIVTPLEGSSGSGAVVMHIDISEKRKRELERMNEQKRMTNAIIRAQEKERNAIGAELHDNVNQILVGTNMILTMLKSTPDGAGELLDSCITNIRSAIEENRKIAHELVSPDTSIETLLQQMTRLCQTMLQHAGLKTFIYHEHFSELLLSSEQKLAIYRIIQEQCTNIVKYAQAQNVVFSIATSEGMFTMEIIDDGKGTDNTQISAGIGLKNIASRLSIYDGKVTTESSPGNGFALRIEFPLTIVN